MESAVGRSDSYPYAAWILRLHQAHYKPKEGGFKWTQARAFAHPIEGVLYHLPQTDFVLTLVDGRLALEIGMVGQGTGAAQRMKSARFLKELGQSVHLQRTIYRYTHTLMAQVAQTAACNRFHEVEARLARCLL